MVRLRRLNQALDVTLMASERPEEQASAPAAGGASPGAAPAAAGAESDGCGERKRRANFKFEVRVTLAPIPIAPVDGRGVPRSLGGGA